MSRLCGREDPVARLACAGASMRRFFRLVFCKQKRRRTSASAFFLYLSCSIRYMGLEKKRRSVSIKLLLAIK